MVFHSARIPLRILVVLALFPLAAAHATADDLEEKFVAANAKLNSGEHQAALEMYNEILEAEPRAGNVWINRAIAKWNLKDRSGARADLAQAISLHPDNVEAYRIRASLRYQMQDFSGSLSDLDLALRYVDDDAELHGMRGEVLRALGSPEPAHAALSRAIELKADYAVALYTRGQVNEELNRIDAALRDYSRVIELDAKHGDALNNRGWIRFHRLDWAGAIADGRAVIKIAPNAAIAQRLLGYAAFGQGDYQLAATTLAHAAELSKDDSESSAFALLVRHFALARLGQPDKRLATSWGAWENEWLKGLARFVVGQIDEDALEKLIASTDDEEERNGRTCEAHFYIGLMRLQAGDKSTARLRFQAAVNTQQKTFIEHALAQAELKRL